MIKKLREVKSFEHDFVIIGAGPAGITVALELEKYKKTVLLLEGGGLEYSKDSQSIYKGQVAGDENFSVKNSRLRYFGGTSNHWGGMCRPFSRSELSAFPIDKQDLDTHLSAACRILEISDQFKDDIKINENFERIDFKFSPPVRFNAKYKKSIADSNYIDLILNANVVSINGVYGKVSNIDIYDQNLNRFNLKINKLILACGGLENSRLLLWSKYLNKEIFDDLPIGEKWMEHPHFKTGEIILHSSDLEHVFGKEVSESGTHKVFLQPTKLLMKAKDISHAGIRFELYQSKSKLKRIINDILCINPEYGKKLVNSLSKKNLMCSAEVSIAWEQLPKDKNRISLDFLNKDKFGVPRILLDWSVDYQDKKTALVCMQQLGKLFLESNIGRVGIFEYLYNQYSEVDEEYGGACCVTGGHHMGGTPMGVTADSGVVDSNLKVFNVDNLWIGGSSIFPSGGHVNLTLTIVQFALRLGRHLSDS